MDYFENIKIVVWGGDHHNTLGVIRSLGEKKIKVSAIIQTKESISYVSKSRYISEYWIVKSDLEGLNILFSLKKLNTKIVLFSCSDSVSSIIDSNYNKLKQWCFLQGCGAEGSVNKLMNKVTMNSIASKVGLKILDSWKVKNTTIPDYISFPCISKPLYSISGSKSNIEIFYNCTQLEKYLISTHKVKNIDLIIQPYLKNKSEFQLIGCSIESGNKIIIPGVADIIRSSKVTNTGLLSYMPIELYKYKIDLLIERCNQFIKNIKYSGLFSLEFIVDEYSQVYFLEINMRNDGNAYAVTCGGINLPYLWLLSCVDVNLLKSEEMEVKEKIIVNPEVDDFFLLLTRKISIFIWLKSIFKTNYFIEFSRKDFKPFICLLLKILYMKLKKLV